MNTAARYAAIPLACLLVALSACTSTQEQPEASASAAAEEVLRTHIAHGGIATIATSVAYTELLARNQAIEKARGDLVGIIDLKIANLKQELVRNVGNERIQDANNFFNALANDMRRKVPITSRAVFNIEERIEERAHAYAVLVQNPSLLLAYLDLHGAEYPTVYPLLRASPGYQQLTRDATTYKRFLAAHTQP
jgi:hypothetical protein